jgi:hypothetical protein
MSASRSGVRLVPMSFESRISSSRPLGFQCAFDDQRAQRIANLIAGPHAGNLRYLHALT